MLKLGFKNGAVAGTPAAGSAKAPNQFLTTHLVPVTGVRAHARAPFTQQQQQHVTRRNWAAAAASSDEQEPVIDVEAATVSSSSSSSSSSSRSPLDDIAQAAAGAVEDASDAATATVNAAADAASAVVSDASDVASALVNDAAAAASAATAAVAAAAGEAGGAPIDWQSSSGAAPDSRFAGMKVLVVGATGGVGRRCVEALRAKGVACRALVKDAARAANLLPKPTTPANSSSGTSGGPEFDVMTGDVYQYATLPRAFAGCDAVIVASAANDKSDPFGPFKIDYQGTLNLIAAAKRAGVKRFVFVTSIGADDPFNPLNLFWGILFWKKRAEEELQRSGLSYTIVRPGGLKSKLGDGEVAGSIVMEGPDSFGFPPMRRSGAILRSQVADVCVEALVCPAAADKVVEVIAVESAPERSLQQLFESVSL
uniref:NAD(P)-binding domain-containing protein n=1 Tax=Tetradesmus obliquus TaxID=3088 RepID=A0A383VB59_TETOB|eukprot:jgi/Sobl393_1/18165/SZX62183.1